MIQPPERATGIQWVRARFGDSCPVVTSLRDGSQGPPPSVFRPWCYMPPPTWRWGWSPCGQRNIAEGMLYQPGVRLWRTVPSGWCSFPLAFGSLARGHTSTMSCKPPGSLRRGHIEKSGGPQATASRSLQRADCHSSQGRNPLVLVHSLAAALGETRSRMDELGHTWPWGSELRAVC